MKLLRKSFLMCLLVCLMLNTFSFASTIPVSTTNPTETSIDLSYEAPPEFLDSSPNFLVKLILQGVGFFVRLLGLGVDLVVIDFEELISPTSPFLFSFNLKNMFGLASANMYSLIQSIAVMMVMPQIAIIASQLIISTRSYSFYEKLKESSRFIIFAGIAFSMPKFVDIILGIRGNLVSAASASAINNGTISNFFFELAKTGTMFNSILYLAFQIFIAWLAINYLMLTATFTVIFTASPFLILSSYHSRFSDRIEKLKGGLLGYVFTPIIDIGVLLLISSILLIDPVSYGISVLNFNLIVVVFIMLVIPIRSYFLSYFGLGSFLENVSGTSMLFGLYAAYNMTRGRKRSSSNDMGSSGTGSSSNETVSDQEQKTYHEEINNYKSVAASGNEQMTSNYKDLLTDKYYGKNYFNESDIGGLSSAEKANYFGRKLEQDEINKLETDRINAEKRFAKGLRAAGGFTATTIGAGSMMFLGPRGMALGALGANALYNKIADKIPSSFDEVSSHDYNSAIDPLMYSVPSEMPELEEINLDTNSNPGIAFAEKSFEEKINNFSEYQKSIFEADLNSLRGGLAKQFSTHIDNVKKDMVTSASKATNFSEYSSALNQGHIYIASMEAGMDTVMEKITEKSSEASFEYISSKTDEFRRERYIDVNKALNTGRQDFFVKMKDIMEESFDEVNDELGVNVREAMQRYI